MEAQWLNPLLWSLLPLVVSILFLLGTAVGYLFFELSFPLLSGFFFEKKGCKLCCDDIIAVALGEGHIHMHYASLCNTWAPLFTIAH